MKNMRVSTLIIIVLLICAVVFGGLGFAQAPNSMVSPAAVSTYMLISAGIFAILAVMSLRRKEMWQRFLGVVAIMAALYMVGMALLFFRGLSMIQAPEYGAWPALFL